MRAWRHGVAVFLGSVLACVGALGPAAAVDFNGQTVAMIVGAEAGGGTDATARLVAPFFEKYLPGHPTVIVQNRPGASGVTALNYIVQQTKPDGLTVIGGGNAQLSPVTYRKAHGVYDPRTLRVIGGLGRGGTVIIVNKEHEKRLYDTSQPPVFFGALDGNRSNEQIVFWGMEYLGWNVKVVVGYRGTNDQSIAMERGEIDMHSTGNMFLVKKLMDTGQFRILAQSGMLANGTFKPRPDFADVPVIGNEIKVKITDPIAKQAFAYLESFSATDKWLGLRDGTPDDILAAYRTAFRKMTADPEFQKRSESVAEDMAPQTPEDVELLIDQMAGLTVEAQDYIRDLQRRHGLNVK